MILETISATETWGEFSARLPATLPHLKQLSPAERLVAVHLAEGLSNHEIAVALGKSQATVKNQVSAILHKLAVPTRARLIARLR
jgi:DNA-binding NarL/FixJ family response regulator